LQDQKKTSPEEIGSVLHYLVGTRTYEFLNEQKNLERLGLESLPRDDLYIELTIINMFIMIKQFTAWEKNEDNYSKALDQMHFLLFHQLKEYSNYDKDDIEQLHEHVFSRYGKYGNDIHNSEEKWSKALSKSFLDSVKNEFDEEGANLFARDIEKFYNSIPNLLRTI